MRQLNLRQKARLSTPRFELAGARERERKKERERGKGREAREIDGIRVSWKLRRNELNNLASQDEGIKRVSSNVSSGKPPKIPWMR